MEKSSPSGVTEITGDLFSLAPANAVLVHACNTRGQWGAGIARRFRELYPQAYRVYTNHCKTSNLGDSLLGTALLIPPQPGEGKGNWIACLFTSHDYGRRKGSPDSIVHATREALVDLKGQLEKLKSSDGKEGTEGPGEIWACKFNSKNFGVAWARSRNVVEEVGIPMIVVEFE